MHRSKIVRTGSVATAALLAAMAAGCANHARTGALTGAGAGAGIGALVGEGVADSPAAGAAIGAAVGGGTGYAIGNERDKAERRRLEHTRRPRGNDRPRGTADADNPQPGARSGRGELKGNGPPPDNRPTRE